MYKGEDKERNEHEKLKYCRKRKIYKHTRNNENNT